MTLQQLCQCITGIKEPTVRELLFDRQGNGLNKAVRHFVRKLLIDEEKCFNMD